MPQPSLKLALDRLYELYNQPAAAVDPIQIVRRYTANEDREVAGFCAAALAFGRVASVMSSIELLLRAMGPSPADFVRRFDPRSDGGVFDGLVHRWTRGNDFVALLWILRVMLAQSGSIERFFLEGYDPRSPDVGPAVESFVARARRIDLHPAYRRPAGRASSAPTKPGVYYFFPSPATGGACKRLNLFLRWMVRSDRIDLGVWSGVSRSKLIVPLDTHVIRVGRCLGLTRYASPGWRMAVDITRALRQLDPDDPVKYDFSLCHVGMQDACVFNRPAQVSRCPLGDFCRPRGRRRRSSRAPSDRR